jgi:hypothetical protein
VSLRSRGSTIRGSVTSLAWEVVTTLSTPAGTPTSHSRSASASIVSGVCEAGLTTIVQPAAIAGPIFRVPIGNGTFHGVIMSVGPTGCFIIISRVAPSGEVAQRPATRTTSSEKPAEELRPVGHLAPGLRQGLTHLQRHQQREVLGPLGDPLDRGAQDLCAYPRRGSGPLRLRRDGRVQRRLAVLHGRVGDLGQRVPGRRILHDQAAPEDDSRHSPPMNRPVGTLSRSRCSSILPLSLVSVCLLARRVSPGPRRMLLPECQGPR